MEALRIKDLIETHSRGQKQYRYFPFFPRDGITRNRRTYLATAGTVFGGLLAGCLGDESGSQQSNGEDDNAAELTATLQTSMGQIDVELFAEHVPRTVENFVGLATGEQPWRDPETDEEITDEPLYSDVFFHRVIDDFMIQTGDPTGTGRGGPGYRFDDEFHDELRHDGPGVLSMANGGPDTNGSQFFITLEAQPTLDGRHAVFGAVTDGMTIVREIGAVETDADDRPLESVVLESVSVDRGD